MNLPRITISLFFAVVLILALTTIGSRKYTASQQPWATTSNSQVKLLEGMKLDGYAIGPTNANVVIVEFSDYSCENCKYFSNEILPALLETYSKDLRFLHKDFPLEFNPAGWATAEAADCAGLQGRYWAYRKLLYMVDQQSPDFLRQHALQLGLKKVEFTKCLTNHAPKQQIEHDIELAKELQVTGTPTFFIGKYKIIGSQPLSVFKQVVEAALTTEREVK